MKSAHMLTLISSCIFILLLMIISVLKDSWFNSDWLYVIGSLLWVGFLIWRLFKKSELP
jgi:hypothetical protein